MMTSVLFLGACIGHAAFWIYTLNRSFGTPLPRRVHSLLRILAVLLVLAGPILFWMIYGFDLGPVVGLESGSLWGDLLSPYVGLCWLLGFVLVPLVTLGRLLARPPAALLSNHTQTIDVAAELGYKPIGHGKHRHLARLPRNEVFQVDFSERTYFLPRCPAAWDGLSILHLSDVHFCGTPDREFYRLILDQCRAWEPDLLALTGDIVDSKRHHRWIVPLLGRLRWRIAAFAVLGNHDVWYDPELTRRRLERLGIRVLQNNWEQLEVHGQPLTIIGHEGPWFRPAPDMSGCGEAAFRLCLSHTPDNMPWARRHAIDLLLAGHNHGGQIRLPVIGPLMVPSLYGRHYDCGSFYEAPTLMHVSRGLAGQHPLRYNCRPEVTKIVLRARDPG